MQNSVRKPLNSLQKLTECLCDGRNMPLLQDPALAEVDLCYKAIPHYKSFVTKRETLVNRRIKEGEEAGKLEEKARRLEEEAARLEEKAAKAKGKSETERERQGTEKEKERHGKEKEMQGKEKQKQKLKREQIEREIPDKNQKFLKGNNQPIPIKNEDEFAHLFLEDGYSHLSRCNILVLNLGAILTVLSKASCFPEDLRNQALSVMDVRNSWLCSEMNNWTQENTTKVISELTALAQRIPGAQHALKMREVKFPGIAFHSNAYVYKSCIKEGQHEKVQFKIKKLESDHGCEIYVERSYKETETGKQTSDVKDLILKNKVVLLKGEAGAGKSSVVTKLIQRWAEGKEAEDISCILFLSAGSEGKLSLYRILWDGHNDSAHWKEEDFHESYLCLKSLAIEGKVLVLIDGLDEFGNFTARDVVNASQASSNPHLEVELRTACAGILAQKIFPGARVLATGRTTSLINEQLLEGNALLFDLVPLTEADREVMVEKMQEDINDRGRVQQELQRISTKSTEVFFKSPLMLKNIIQLIIEKKVDVNNLKCPSEVYLMLAMKNLDFQKDKITDFLELDPPEDQDYLKMCMMICQQKIQQPEKGGNINTIEGIQRNTKEKGLCFEKTVFKEHLQIPIEFIKKLGFFDIRKEGSKFFLDIVHLSYMEFCCAGSLCREGVNIEEELSKIKDTERYEAVTT